MIYNPWKRIKQLEAELQRNIDDVIRERSVCLETAVHFTHEGVSVYNATPGRIYLAYLSDEVK